MTIRDASLSSDPHPTFPTTDPPMVTIGPWTPNADAIADLARSALGEPTAADSAWRVEPVGYDFGSPTTEGLFRIRGDARVGGAIRRWSVFVKVVRAYRHWPLFHVLPPDMRAAALAGDQWRYEADVYLSGLPDALPDGLRLPVVHRIIDLGDDRLAIVLEDVECCPEGWNDRRFAAAATLLGRFAVRSTRRNSLPRSAFSQRGAVTRSYYSGRLLPAAFPALSSDALWQHPLLAHAAGLRQDLDELANRVPAILDSLEQLPQFLVHGDASPQNLLVPLDEPAGFVIIDWTLGGPAAVGDDLGQLLVGLAHAGEIDTAQLPALHELLITAYRIGLETEGIPVPEDRVRHGMDGGLVVRSAFTALPLQRLHEPITVELARLFSHRLRLTRYLVDLGLALTTPTPNRAATGSEITS